MVFVLARELLESDERGSTYPTLKLYGDWALHSKLDRRNAKNVLCRVNELLAADASGERVDFVIEVSKFLGVEKLRAELRELLRSNRLPTFLVDSDLNWNRLVSKFLTSLRDKPLIGSKFTEEEESTGCGCEARALRLVSESDHGSMIHWQIQLGPRVFVDGELM
jgi:hypothetical protein